MYQLIFENINDNKKNPLNITEKIEDVIYNVESNLNNVDIIYKNSLRSIKNKIKKLNNIFETNNVIFESTALNDDNVIEYSSNLIYTITDSIHCELVRDGNLKIVNHKQLFEIENDNVGLLKEILTEFDVLTDNYSKINNCRIDKRLFYSKIDVILESWDIVDKIKTFLLSLVNNGRFIYNLIYASLFLVSKKKQIPDQVVSEINKNVNESISRVFNLDLITEFDDSNKNKNFNQFKKPDQFKKPNDNNQFRNSDQFKKVNETGQQKSVNFDGFVKTNYDSDLSKYYNIQDIKKPVISKPANNIITPTTNKQLDTIQSIVNKQVDKPIISKQNDSLTLDKKTSDIVDPINNEYINKIITIAKMLKNNSVDYIKTVPIPILFTGVVGITKYLSYMLKSADTTSNFFNHIYDFIVNPLQIQNDSIINYILPSFAQIPFVIGCYWVVVSFWRIVTGKKTKSNMYWMYLKLFTDFFVYFNEFNNTIRFYLNDAQKIEYQIISDQFERCLKQSFWSRASTLLGPITYKSFGNFHPRCPVKMMLDQIYFLLFYFLNDLRKDIDLNSIRNVSEMINQLNTFRSFKNEKLYELFKNHIFKVEQFEVGLINEVNDNFNSIKNDVLNNLLFSELIIKYPYSEKYFSNYKINKKE